MPVRIKKPQPEKVKIKIRRDQPPIPQPDYINPIFAQPPKPIAPVPIEHVVPQKKSKTTGDSFPMAPPPKGKPRKKVDPAHVEVIVTGKRQKAREGPLVPPPKTRPDERFPGKGQKLPDGAFAPGHHLDSDTKIWMFGKQGATSRSTGGVVPFSGRGQKLPGDGNVRMAAIQRLNEIARAQQRARETVDHAADLRRAARRGGAPGDVVPLGKRKRRELEMDPNPRAATRARQGIRPAGPQRFNIAG